MMFSAFIFPVVAVVVIAASAVVFREFGNRRQLYTMGSPITMVLNRVKIINK